MIKKIYSAKIKSESNITVWGSGNPKREFLHVDDLAYACVFFIKNIKAKTIYDQFKVSHINIGSGTDIPIKLLAKLICDIIGFEGKLKFDRQKPDGTPRKLMDSSRANQLGWKPRIMLKDGLRQTVEDFISSH